MCKKKILVEHFRYQQYLFPLTFEYLLQDILKLLLHWKGIITKCNLNSFFDHLTGYLVSSHKMKNILNVIWRKPVWTSEPRQTLDSQCIRLCFCHHLLVWGQPDLLIHHQRIFSDYSHHFHHVRALHLQINHWLSNWIFRSSNLSNESEIWRAHIHQVFHSGQCHAFGNNRT